MSKKIVHDLTYDAPAEQVAEMLADPEFRKEVCRYQGVTEVEVEVVRNGEGKDVTINQWQPTKGLPAVATKIVGDKTNIIQTEHWTSATEGQINVSIPGKPGDMKGTALIASRGDGCVETVELTIKVGIPLVGGKLEGIIGDLLLKALKAENKVGREWLAR